MVSNTALIFIFHIIVLGVWMARWRDTDRLEFWWKPALYLLCLYITCGILFIQFPNLILPGP